MLTINNLHTLKVDTDDRGFLVVTYLT